MPFVDASDAGNRHLPLTLGRSPSELALVVWATIYVRTAIFCSCHPPNRSGLDSASAPSADGLVSLAARPKMPVTVPVAPLTLHFVLAQRPDSMRLNVFLLQSKKNAALHNYSEGSFDRSL